MFGDGRKDKIKRFNLVTARRRQKENTSDGAVDSFDSKETSSSGIAGVASENGTYSESLCFHLDRIDSRAVLPSTSVKFRLLRFIQRSLLMLTNSVPELILARFTDNDSKQRDRIIQKTAGGTAGSDRLRTFQSIRRTSDESAGISALKSLHLVHIYSKVTKTDQQQYKETLSLKDSNVCCRPKTNFNTFKEGKTNVVSRLSHFTHNAHGTFERRQQQQPPPPPLPPPP